MWHWTALKCKDGKYRVAENYPDLESWTEPVEAQGDTPKDLAVELLRMALDVLKNEPIE